MLILITKRPPALVMDGFDVSRFDVDQVYDVDVTLGRYLILAGYATRAEANADDRSARPKRARD